MPKGGRKGSGKHLVIDQPADVTLDDFANSKISTTRVRKPTTNFLAREVKNLKSVDKLWYEKDLEEFDDDFDANNDKVESVDVSCDKKKGTKKKDNTTTDSTAGVDYPLDLWYLLAEYILPEDIQTFACICKSSFYVIQTFKFWITIYKRYYTPKSELPVHLQPTCIERSYRLRACVICALYYVYSPFVKRLSRPGDDTDKIVKSSCIAFWYHQQGEKWQFFFKFLKSRPNDLHPFGPGRNLRKHNHYRHPHWSLHERRNKYYDPAAIMDDVNANPEEGCCVLRITCPHYIITSPTVMGCKLVDVRVTTSRDMHHRRVQLMFTAANYQSFNRIPMHMFGCSQSGGIGEIVEFDPTESVQILDWWHPQYPSNK
ncbi:transmembrane protein 183 [Centruroides vittatus]|uniref:transmembrane protein 183 n=1 Tax=Centruroides vittatus TaxID=120091 RepID=UPI0035104D83